jgi:hypothetical protein
VLRGVRIGLATDDDAIARVGVLKSVKWSLLRNEEGWQSAADETQMTGDATIMQQTGSIGILAEINYEKLAYSAILLKDVRKPGQDDIVGFSHYPLLLTRMPASLRETLLDFLAATFDTRASILKLPSSFLAETAEKYLANITTADNGSLESDEATRVLKTVIKDILITLSFDIPSVSLSLKTVDFTISKEDSWRMITNGRKLLQIEENKQNSDAKISRPFTRSLTHHVNAHLGLKLDNAHVQISRVACGAFVLGTEGKVKLSAPPNVGDEEDVQRNATKELLNGLIELATGGKTVTMIDLS